MEVNMEEISSEIRSIPEGAKYIGFDALLRAAELSPEFRRKYSLQRDRLQEYCQEYAAEQILKLKEQGEKEEAAYTMMTDLRVNVRCDSSSQVTAQVDLEPGAPHSTTNANSVQRTSKNRVTKPAQETKVHRLKQEGKVHKPKQEGNQGQEKPKRVRGRVPSVRQAAIKTMAKFLETQSPDQLNALIRAAEIEATILQYDIARTDTTLQTKSKRAEIQVIHQPADGWNKKEVFERAQLCFFLGRAMVETFDQVAAPTSSHPYNVGMYQDLIEGKDVNSLSRLARGMMTSTTCSMPANGDFVTYNTAVIRGLLNQVSSFERNKTSDRGFWTKRGCALSLALGLMSPNAQLPTPDSLMTDNVDDSN